MNELHTPQPIGVYPGGGQTLPPQPVSRTPTYQDKKSLLWGRCSVLCFLLLHWVTVLFYTVSIFTLEFESALHPYSGKYMGDIIFSRIPWYAFCLGTLIFLIALIGIIAGSRVSHTSRLATWGIWLNALGLIIGEILAFAMPAVSLFICLLLEPIKSFFLL